MKTKYLFFLIGGIALGAIIWLGINNRQPQSAANVSNNLSSGILTAEHNFYDFGSIPIGGGKVDHEFILKNNSSGDVKIGQVFTSCMCTEAFLAVGDKTKGPFGMSGHGWTPQANLAVASGEELKVKTVFDPAAHGPSGIGPVEREVYLDVGQAQPLILSFKAVVTP